MKISKIRNNKYLKLIFLVVICYLLASVGTNGVVNPFRFLNNCEKKAIDFFSDDEFVIIDLSEKDEQYKYLNIYVDNMNTFMREVNVTYNYYEGVSDEDNLQLSKGNNSYKIMDWNSVALNLRDIDVAEIEIGQVYISEKKIVEFPTMMKVFVSFLALVLFYEGMQRVKKKYAK